MPGDLCKERPQYRGQWRPVHLLSDCAYPLIIWPMPTTDLTDEEHAAVTAAVRRSIADDRYPMSPRLAPLKSALAKLDPASVPKTLPERKPLPEAPARARGGRRARR